MKRTIATVAIAALAAVVAPASAEATTPHALCFDRHQLMRLTAAIPIVPGYCLVSSHTGKPMPGTVNRGVVTYHGNSATVRIYRAGAWSTYRYVVNKKVNVVWHPMPNSSLVRQYIP